MQPEVVFAIYRPKPGQDEALLGLLRRHLPTLRRLGLATERPALLLGSKDASIEVFEWASSEASAQAHTTPEVAEIWRAIEGVAEFPPLDELEESKQRFPHFVALDGVVES